MADLVAVALLGSLLLYVLLGGADFGGGIWYLLASGPRKNEQRKLIDRAISPVWEANHVWLILAVVILFTGFPVAFASISTFLHIPLTLMLIGIVFRGAGFAFAHSSSQSQWSLVFSLASLLTPFFLGVIVGAILSGEMPVTVADFKDFINPWLGIYPIVVGFLTVSVSALLAAVYLAVEAKGTVIEVDFRIRAIRAQGVMMGVALLAALLLDRGAPDVSYRFYSATLLAIQSVGTLLAIATLLSLIRHQYLSARLLAALQVTCLLVGWGVAKYPYIVPPLITVNNGAAPESTLRLLLGALSVGLVVLIPSLLYLLRIFKKTST